jgi:hypothetical protein
MSFNRADGAEGISYWTQVHEEQIKLEKVLISMPWQKADCIYMCDNGRKLPGMHPNPRITGAVSIIGNLKKAAELILIGNHDLCTQAEVEAYEAAQEKKRAEMGMAAAAKRGTIQFQPPTSSNQPEIESLKARLAALEGGAK